SAATAISAKGPKTAASHNHAVRERPFLEAIRPDKYMHATDRKIRMASSMGSLHWCLPRNIGTQRHRFKRVKPVDFQTEPLPRHYPQWDCFAATGLLLEERVLGRGRVLAREAARRPRRAGGRGGTLSASLGISFRGSFLGSYLGPFLGAPLRR